MRRFSFVLKWLGLVVLASTLLLRLPLLLAYFRDVPGVLDYLPIGRGVMAALIICFAAMQVSLVLHNETLREAFRAHWQFVRRHAVRLRLVPAHLRGCTSGFSPSPTPSSARPRPSACSRFCSGNSSTSWPRAFVTGWLLASWVCLFRQCEIGRVNRETWIRY